MLSFYKQFNLLGGVDVDDDDELNVLKDHYFYHLQT